MAGADFEVVEEENLASEDGYKAWSASRVRYGRRAISGSDGFAGVEDAVGVQVECGVSCDLAAIRDPVRVAVCTTRCSAKSQLGSPVSLSRGCSTGTPERSGLARPDLRCEEPRTPGDQRKAIPMASENSLPPVTRYQACQYQVSPAKMSVALLPGPGDDRPGRGPGPGMGR